MSEANSPPFNPGQTSQEKNVRSLYEQLPYPPRNPEDEKKRLVRTSLDFIPRISHYCFSGQLDLSKPFKILIAGGGTGDSAIYLAEQTRHTRAEIVYIDVSNASMQVAIERAKVRQLDHISFHRGSILELGRLSLGNFDFINCSGVLHHLENPTLGLQSLEKALSPDGVIGIMVYAEYGRTAIYQVQKLMQLILNEQRTEEKIDLARKILNSLPNTNWLARSDELHNDHEIHGDAGLADLFLHPCDRAYTVPQLYEWLNDAGLELIDFASNKLFYNPLMYIKEPELQSIILKKSKIDQQAIAELLSGSIIKHVFYTGRTKIDMPKVSNEMIPVLSPELNPEGILSDIRSKKIGEHVLIKKPGAALKMPVNPISETFFQHADKFLTIAELTDRLIQQPALKGAPVEWVKDQLTALCELLINSDMLYMNRILLHGNSAKVG